MEKGGRPAYKRLMASEPDPAEIERRLAIRTAELEAANRHIDELLEKVRALRESKRKLSAAREERDAIRASVEYRLGRKIAGPFLKLARAFSRPQAKPAPSASPASYQEWVLRNRPSAAELGAMRTAAEEAADPLRFTLLMLAGESAPALAESSIQFLLAQAWPHWELVLIGAPARPGDARIRATAPGANAAEALNAAAAPATGEFIGLIEAGDLLEPHALFEAARLLRASPEIDVMYSDEDALDAAGSYCGPVFKPDWSPDALLSANYLGRLTLVRRGLAESAGGFKPGFDGAEEYDLLLRATETARQIAHLPRVLCHRAATAPRAGGIQALAQALVRRGIQGVAEPTQAPGNYRVRRAIADPLEVAIIIPTRDRLELIERCVRSIVSLTDYPQFEIVIIDNDSRNPETLRWYGTLPHRVLQYPGPFNYAAMNNYAARQTTAPWLLFLNNDTEVIEAGWLRAMAEHVQRPEVGAAGARLLYPGDTIQHAGILLGGAGNASHAFCHAPAHTLECGGRAQMICEYSAVTAACMLTRREVFQEMGGFDEMRLPVSYNDVDYCLRLRSAGFLIVSTPFAVLRHHESASRGHGRSDPAAGRLLWERWPGVMARDPYGNPNLGWDSQA